MLTIVNCSRCHAPTLQLRTPGAKSIRCTTCKAVTLVKQLLSPSPYNHAPPGPLPQVHSSKRAVLCGVSYKNSRYELDGCVHDAELMKALLISQFKFPESSIVLLTEEESDPNRRPTKYNMRMALYWLVLGCQSGDSLVFYYSGHGSQQKNYDGDEKDGYDETICPSDFETEGPIVDDEINWTIVRPLPRGVKLHAVIDACHSGTALDLPFLCRMDDRQGGYVWEDHRPRSGLWKGTSGGEVISFSSCDDGQNSIQISSSNIPSTGAMTSCFIQAILHGHGTTYWNLINAMRSMIFRMLLPQDEEEEEEEEGCCAILCFLATLLTGKSPTSGSRQEPQLTASEPFDVETRLFSL
ncbi:Metacaspase 1, putative [Theobroma cacao]|uniref:Metacaspase 1, putative n=1 Tax=Theobroma cacao TaxID=3641 RepID=A0A061G040_THECC|nr:Metacaspase 1, putative [Theobroma cacao]